MIFGENVLRYQRNNAILDAENKTLH